MNTIRIVDGVFAVLREDNTLAGVVTRDSQHRGDERWGFYPVGRDKQDYHRYLDLHEALNIAVEYEPRPL